MVKYFGIYLVIVIIIIGVFVVVQYFFLVPNFLNQFNNFNNFPLFRDPHSQSSSRPRRLKICRDEYKNSKGRPLDE